MHVSSSAYLVSFVTFKCRKNFEMKIHSLTVIVDFVGLLVTLFCYLLVHLDLMEK